MKRKIKKLKIIKKTYNSQDSHLVTDDTTNWPACGLSMAERTGSPVFHTLWSHVTGYYIEGLISSFSSLL